jgi:hypothetical protein
MERPNTSADEGDTSTESIEDGPSESYFGRRHARFMATASRVPLAEYVHEIVEEASGGARQLSPTHDHQ